MEVKAELDLYAYYENECPIYRVWINYTLYNERPYWIDCTREFIQELMFFELEPGEHTIVVEKISAPAAKIWVERLNMKYKDRKLVFDFPINPQDKQIIKFTIE